MFPPGDQQHLRDEEQEESSNTHQIPPPSLAALPTNSDSQNLPEGFPAGRAQSQSALGRDFLLCHSNKGDFLVSISICHTWKFQFLRKKTWISSSKWNHFKTRPSIWARTEMHITGLDGTAKKRDKNSQFLLILFSFHQEVSAQIFQVMSEVFTNTPCSHQSTDKQGLFLPCLGKKLSTGLRKADREQETKHLLHVEKTSHCVENCIERVRHC